MLGLPSSGATSRTSSSMAAPASKGSFSTSMILPGSARYWRPPARTIAYMRLCLQSSLFTVATTPQRSKRGKLFFVLVAGEYYNGLRDARQWWITQYGEENGQMEVAR